MADAKATGVALADPAIARAVGDQMSLTVRASATPEGVVDVETARLTSPSLDARYTGQLGREDAIGTMIVHVPDLTRFGDLASLRLRGILDLDATVQGLMSKAPVTATLDGKATRFGTGIGAIDGLAGGQLAMTGRARMLPNGGFGFQNMEIAGAHALARIDGNATAENVAIDAKLDLPDLRRADNRLTGQGALSAQLTGTLARPNATFKATLRDATALRRPIPQLDLDAAAMDLLGSLDVRSTLSGIIDGKTAKGAVRLLKRPEGGWLLDPLELLVGSANISGNLTLDAVDLATGRLSIDARNLDDLSPLILTPLAGDLRADVVFEATGGQQSMRLDAQGERLRIAGSGVDKLTAKASLSDLYGKPVINAAIAADRAVAAGETFSEIRLEATGTPAASDIVVSAKARGFDLGARGRLVPETPLRLDIASFTARRDRRQIALARPATLTFAAGGVTLRNVEISVDGGRITAEGSVGSVLDLRVAAKAVPLSAADILVPGTGLSGTLEGDARIGGTSAAPTGDWRIRVSQLSAAQARQLGAPLIDVTAQGRLAGSTTSVDGTINAGRGGTFRIQGQVPLSPTGGVDLTGRGRLDLSLANNFLSAQGRQVTGTASVDTRVTGTLKEPIVNGSLTLGGGSFRDALQGVRLDNIQGRIVAKGTDLTIERLTAQTRNSGTISASGRVSLDPAAGFPGDIRINGQRAELVSNDLVTAVADLALSLSGPLARDPRVSGQVRIVSMDVSVPDRLPATVRPIPGTKHVNPPPIVARRLAMEARARANSRPHARVQRDPRFGAQRT